MQVPSLLIDSLKGAKGFDREAFENAHAAEETITSIRINPAKNKLPITSLLPEGSVQVPWSSVGYYLPERPSFTFDPLFHAGLYYVQEASSMFLEQAIRQTVNLKEPVKVLDLCAAPGGKSTMIQSLISKESLLVSNEVIRARANILEENMMKWGGGNVITTNNDPRDFNKLAGFFDLMVVDAPCSGSGLFRRDPTAVSEWSLQNVELCCQRQQRILADVLPALNQDGILIYSTCSYSIEEDEDIMDWLVSEMGMEGIALEIKEEWGIVLTTSSTGASGYRFYPDKLKGEGFFIAAFRKKNSSDSFYPRTSKFDKVSNAEKELLNNWLEDAERFQYIKFKEEILAMPISWNAEYLSVLASMHIKSTGIKIGQIINNSLVPNHHLALSTLMSASIPSIELTKQEAIQFLKKETIQVSTDLKGWALICYKGAALGWVKVLPNRINNYYPKEWRILSKRNG